MRKSKLLLHCLLTICSVPVLAQSPFNTIDSIDINNINASVLVHGDMWTNATDTFPRCEFPKGNHTNMFAKAGVWIAGFDNSSKLHISAAAYRKQGIDYWPGPLSTSTDSIDYATSQSWARIWKINRTTIDSFLALSTHTLSNTPAIILEWPGKGNTYAKGNAGASLTITTDMAPFIDVDHDGLYNPLKGDYPAIKGDQTLWYVFSDRGPTHTETKGLPLGVEIHAMPYAFKKGNALDNLIFYEYTIVNRSTNDYSNFRFGLRNVSGIGYKFDNYRGTDSNRRMQIIYNGTVEDGTGKPGEYGLKIPIAGIMFVHQPGDSDCNYNTPLGSSMYYNNDFSGQGNPSNDTEYYGYLNATWRDGTHLKNDFKGAGIISTGYGSGPNTNYVFSGMLQDSTQWSECTSQNLPADAANMVVSNNFSLPAGSSQSIVIALMAVPDASGCPQANYLGIDSMADLTKAFYCTLPATSVRSISSVVSVRIYPNPAHDVLTIDAGSLAAPNTAAVYNMLGQHMNINCSSSGNKLNLDISQLPPAVYTVQYGPQHTASLFVKQ